MGFIRAAASAVDVDVRVAVNEGAVLLAEFGGVSGVKFFGFV